MELLSDAKIAELHAGLKGLPPGPWEVDGVRQDDAPDRHNEYELLDARGYRLCDTQNCDYRFGEIEIEYDEDGSSAWNEPARLLIEHIARCDPSTIVALLAERSARIAAEAKVADLEAWLAAVTVQAEVAENAHLPEATGKALKQCLELTSANMQLVDELVVARHGQREAEAATASVRMALERLERVAADVARYGATTGPQWVKLTSELLRTRSALALIPAPAASPAPVYQGGSELPMPKYEFQRPYIGSESQPYTPAPEHGEEA